MAVERRQTARCNDEAVSGGLMSPFKQVDGLLDLKDKGKDKQAGKEGWTGCIPPSAQKTFLSFSLCPGTSLLIRQTWFR